MKTEPQTFSIDDLKKSKNSISSWDGVRNYQARNFMKDQMKEGDLVLIYHSSCKEIGIAGLAEVVKEAYPDHTSQDKKSDYFDPKSTKERPIWYMVDVKWLKTYNNILTLNSIKEVKEMSESPITKKGNRLSIVPLTEKQFKSLQKLLK